MTAGGGGGGRRAARARRERAAGSSRALSSAMFAVALAFLVCCPIAVRIVDVDFVSYMIYNADHIDTGLKHEAYTFFKMGLLYVASAVLASLFVARLFVGSDADVNAGDARSAKNAGGARAADSRRDGKAGERNPERGNGNETRGGPPAFPAAPSGLAGPDGVFGRAAEIALASFCAFLLASVFASAYKHVALHGNISMQDGALAHVCYALLFFLGWKVFARSQRPWLFAAPACVAGVVNAVMSLLVFMGVDISRSRLVAELMGAPRGARLGEGTSLASTFGNANYLSGFGGVLFVMSLAALLFSDGAGPLQGEGSAAQRGDTQGRRAGAGAGAAWVPAAFWLFMVGVAFTVIATSLSSSGFFTVAISAPIVFAVALFIRFSWRKVVYAVAAIGLCALIYMPLAAHNPRVADETVMFMKSVVSASSDAGASDAPAAPAARGAFAASGAEFQGSVATGRLMIDASTNGALEASQPATQPISRAAELQAPVPAAPPVAVQTVVAPASLVAMQTVVAPAAPAAPAAPLVPLAVTDASPQRAIKGLLPPVMPEPGISPGTGRLYIWKEMIRLIARRPVFGYGMDTITYTFPQFDGAKTAGLGDQSIFVTKPHSIYVGYAYGAGIPALLAFLVVAAYALARFCTFIAACRKDRAPLPAYVICFMASWCAYLLQGFVNDDIAATASVWWTLGGIALGAASARAPSRAARG